MYKKLESIWNKYHAIIPCDCDEFAKYMQIITKIRNGNVVFTWTQREVLHRMIGGIRDVIANDIETNTVTQDIADTYLSYCMRIERALNNSDLAEIKGDLDEFKGQLDEFDAKLDAVEAKVDELDAKLDELDAKLDAFETDVKHSLHAHP